MATCTLAATNVAGLPGCLYFSHRVREIKSDNDDRDFCELFEKGTTWNGSQGHEVTHEVAERAAGMGESVKAGKQFAGANN